MSYNRKLSPSVAAYNRLTNQYRRISLSRAGYLNAVDEHFLSLARDEGFDWLDIGSGDGVRALSLNRTLNKNLSVLEPSKLLPENFRLEHPEVQIFRQSAENLSLKQEFDVVTMLWNVIGHVDNLEACFAAIRDCLRPSGLLYFDANSALNIRRFGIRNVSRNLRHRRSVKFPWPDADSESEVEIFRQSFLRSALKATGFQTRFLFMDYENGQLVRNQFQGSVIVMARRSD